MVWFYLIVAVLILLIMFIAWRSEDIEIFVNHWLTRDHYPERGQIWRCAGETIYVVSVNIVSRELVVTDRNPVLRDEPHPGEVLSFDVWQKRLGQSWGYLDDMRWTSGS